MPRFAVNLSMLFCEYPLIERFAAAARAGFDAVEIQFPYTLSPAQIAEQLEANNQQLILFNLPAGDWPAGERGIACLPERVEEFRRGVDLALDYALPLGVTRLNCLAGIKPDGLSDDAATRVFSENLRYAAEKLAPHGIELLIEAINSRDIPGFWLDGSAQAFRLIDQLGQINLGFQYDVYHMQIMEGNLINTLTDNLPMIRHIQIADLPGRHEPGSGEINFPNLFKALDAMGYSGFVSLEYTPAGLTEQGLGWLSQIGN